MFKHVVSIKLKESANGFSKAENARQAKAILEGMNGRIPSMLKMEAGINVAEDSSGYDLAACSEFASREDFDAYMIHPVHEVTMQFLRKVSEGRVVINYET